MIPLVRNCRRRAFLALVMACTFAGFTVSTFPAEAQTPMTPTSSPASSSLPTGTLEVRLVEIVDPNGFERPMPAARALVPAGWKPEGGVRWNQGMPGCADPATFAWSAASPDGLSRIELFPTELWQASTFGGSQCQYAPFQDVRSYLTAYVQRRYPGAQPVDYRSREDFLDLQQPWLDMKLQMVNAAGLGMRAWADAGELTYTHRENGVEIDGVVSASATFYSTSTPNPLGGYLMSLTAQTTSTFGARAPKGQFDLKTMEAIRKSVKPDAEWAQKYFEFLNRLGGIQTQGVKDRAAIIVAGGAALTASTIAANKAAGERAVKNSYADPMPAWRDQQNSEDRMQRERIEGVRGVETYDDPVYGGTVQLDATYDHAWRVNNADSYILTNDPNFNPGQYNIDAQQLKVTR